MLPDFTRTTRALAADRGPALVASSVGMGIAGVWALWMALGQVTLYESSNAARVVAEGTATLRAPVAAEVVGVEVALGQAVAADALLVQLDDTTERTQLRAAEATVAGTLEQLARREAAGEASQTGRAADAMARRAALARARAELNEATLRLRAAQTRRDQIDQLVAAGAVSGAERDRAIAEVDVLAAREEAARREVGRLRGQQEAQAATGEAGARRDEEEASALEVALRAAEATRDTLQDAVAERAVRSPVAGTVGELTPLTPGQRVEAGALLAVVVPDSTLLVDARFPPERAVGRVAPGQTARIRMAGATGGTLGARVATVARVGSEPGPDGMVPVQLELVGDTHDLHHGLLAEVEVAVETLAPWHLVVRAAGGASQ